MSESYKANFKARSHILSLLGDELIGSDNLALFELVKNAYDADASRAEIRFINLGQEDIAIVIEDDGVGMSREVLENSWLEIGTDFKRGKNRKISNKYSRESLGEKGVGRLAVHKLATDITLETRDEETNESFRLSFNWPSLIGKAKYIEDTEVTLRREKNLSFLGEKHGTRITLNNLRKKKWERGDIRTIYRTVNTLISPFQTEDSFTVKLMLDEEYNEWIEDIFDPHKILGTSIYEYDFYLSEDGTYSWEYSFRPPFKSDMLKGYSINNFQENKKDKILIKPESKTKKKIYRGEDLEKIGRIKGKFYLFNQRPEILKVFNNTKTIKEYLNENHGVRVYRDKLRVYNYGEPGNDWLNLNLLRANNPGKTISNNNIIGSIQLDLKSSHDFLKEKTNREGFDENEVYRKLKDICLSIIKHFAITIQDDREALEEQIKSFKPVKKAGFSESIKELKSKVEEKKLYKEFRHVISRIEDDYNQMREVMLNSGLSGMNLSLVFHELQREVKSINHDIGKTDIEDIRERIKFLYNLIEGFSPILKQNQSSVFSCKKLLGTLKSHNSGRFNYHDIIFSCPVLTDEAPDFNVNGPDNLIFSAINNLIDNSIYWSTVRSEKDESIPPAILITTDLEKFRGPAILVADNGDGFKMDTENITKPFYTLKPGGIGLGLYFTSLVMELCGGEVVFMNPADLEIPSSYNGAVVALVFNPEID
ncbi:ATP-binding protein [uncultured Sunxiuqinia sp.]|uniref:ATP-binding protein n=1 Tax=uncultured Sunxiuqinia sp. TaxID=1573825 RepID=UPI0026396DA9|nr:ATP-binding protein [uncultured Sunxiuqinia sp.]